MRRNTGLFALSIVVAIALLSGGCAGSHQARNVDVTQAMLVNPEMLQPGTGDQMLYRYVNRKVDIKKYSQFMADPVLISKAGEFDAEQLQNYQKLANNAYIYLVQEMGKSYKIVASPEPGTMRIQVAIIDADRSKPVRMVLSSTIPYGIAINVVKYAFTGKPTAVGEITAEIKVTDAMTGEVMGAGLDRRVGNTRPQSVIDSWDNANDALQYWAKRMTYIMCYGRGDANCEKP